MGPSHIPSGSVPALRAQPGRFMGAGWFRTTHQLGDSQAVAKFYGWPLGTFRDRFRLNYYNSFFPVPFSPRVSRVLYSSETNREVRAPENQALRADFHEKHGTARGEHIFREFIVARKSNRDREMVARYVGDKYVTPALPLIGEVRGKPAVVEVQRWLDIRNLGEAIRADPSIAKDAHVRTQVQEIASGLRRLHDENPYIYPDVGLRHLEINPKTRRIVIPDAQLFPRDLLNRVRYPKRDDKIQELEELVR